jgi:hypothetical protein
MSESTDLPTVGACRACAGPRIRGIRFCPYCGALFNRWERRFGRRRGRRLQFAVTGVLSAAAIGLLVFGIFGPVYAIDTALAPGFAGVAEKNYTFPASRYVHVSWSVSGGHPILISVADARAHTVYHRTGYSGNASFWSNGHHYRFGALLVTCGSARTSSCAGHDVVHLQITYGAV